MTRTRKARLLMLAAVAVWGATFVLVKNALSDVSPLLFNFIRMTIAFLCLAAVYRREWKRLSRRSWMGGAAVGLFVAIGYEFQTSGLRLTTAAKSAFITGLTVVLVPLLAAMPGLRPAGASAPRWNVWLGAMFAFVGIVLLTTPPAGPGLESLPAQIAAINRGDLLTLVCAFGFALQIIVQDHFSRNSALKPNRQKVPFEQLTLLQIGFAALFMGVTTPFLEKPFVHFSGRVVLALAVTSIFATAFAFAIQSWVQQILPPAHLVLLVALEPVFAWITSLALLGEGLSFRASFGAALILAGIGSAEWIRPPAEPTRSEGTSLP